MRTNGVDIEKMRRKRRRIVSWIILAEVVSTRKRHVAMAVALAASIK